MKHTLVFLLIELLTSINITTEDPSYSIKNIKNLLKRKDIITLEKCFNTHPKLINDIQNRLQKKQQKNTQLQTTLNTVIASLENKKTKAKL